MFSLSRANWPLVLASLLGLVTAEGASAYVTDTGQVWNFAPDAWTRGNNADTSHFGWDNFVTPGNSLLPTVPFPTGARVLDDSTPDIGSSTTARIFQGTDGDADPDNMSWLPTVYGHAGASGNYYSGFDEETNFADDTITAIAPASGAGGYTTVVLQIIGNTELNKNLDIGISGANWTLDKHLFGSNGTSGLYWVEWWAPGDNLSFAIDINSDYAHVAIDAIQVDTFWTGGAAPALNSIQVIPEPASLSLIGLASCIATLGVRRTRRS